MQIGLAVQEEPQNSATPQPPENATEKGLGSQVQLTVDLLRQESAAA